ncbi:MAG: bifunctional UDP-sugar hydrolase/5'-nucleotidase [Vicinamibacterales bacterium]
MRRTVSIWCLSALLACAGLHVHPRAAWAQQEEPTSPRRQAPITILQINDVYSTVPIDGVGGLARVATINKDLIAAGRSPILMMGGDFLSSSVASSVFKGEQMIEGLNAMGLDITAFGNHEFDFGVDMLLTRMKQSKFQWVNANLVDRTTGRLLGDTPPYVVRDVNGLKVGVLGLCIIDEGMATPELRQRLQMLDPVEMAAKYVPQMRQEGIDIVVILSHLRIRTDQTIAERVPGVDVIVGGHEHYPITAVSGQTLISKAGMDARAVARIDVARRPNGMIDRYYELIPVNASVKDDPATAAVVDAWERRLSETMSDTIGNTTEPLDAVDIRLRSSETNISNLIADAVRAEAKADVALLNSGAIRGNRVYPAGPLRRRDIIAMHPFGNVICTVEMTGATLLETLDIGVARLPAADGRFPAVSGVTFTVTVSAPVGQRVSNVRVNGQPLDPAKSYTVAMPNYVLNGGDGYTNLTNVLVLVNAEQGPLIVSAIETFIGGRTIGPKIDGRITVRR